MTDLPWGNNQNLTDEEFYNRESELVNIKNILHSTSQGHAPDLLLTGIRGVGKTVFLKKLKRELAEVQGSRFQVELHNRIADVLLPERV